MKMPIGTLTNFKIFSYFYGRKYEVKPFEKECGMCWAIKSSAIVTGCLAVSTGMTQLLINIYDDIFSRKVLSGERLIQSRYWSFWGKVCLGISTLVKNDPILTLVLGL